MALLTLAFSCTVSICYLRSLVMATSNSIFYLASRLVECCYSNYLHVKVDEDGSFSGLAYGLVAAVYFYCLIIYSINFVNTLWVCAFRLSILTIKLLYPIIVLSSLQIMNTKIMKQFHILLFNL